MWPGDFGRKKRAPQMKTSRSNHDSISGLPITSNNSVLARYPTSQCTTVSTTTTPSTIITMTGATTASTAVTLDSSSVLAQHVSPAQSAQHSLMQHCIASISGHTVVTDTAACYSSTLEAATYSSTVSVSCLRPAMTVSGCSGSVICQSKPTKTGGKTRDSEHQL